MRTRLFLIGVLLAVGACWGVTLSLARIVVSGGYRPAGILFWQLVIGVAVLGALTFVRGRTLPLERRHLRLYAIIAVLGTIAPGAAAFTSVVHLPAGILALLTSLAPMLTFPIALALGTDRFSMSRLLGLALGLVGVALIALPESSLPEPAMILFIPLALLTPLFYALENNYVARWGTEGLDAVQVLFGASLIGAVMCLPVALLRGEFIDPVRPWGPPELALVLSSCIHAGVYSTYVWLVGRAGAVFAAQAGYLVTGFGVVWAIVLLSERYSGWVWLAMLVMFTGLFLVQPRPKAPLAEPDALGQDTP